MKRQFIFEQAGFTLVELMVTTVVIAILAGAGFISYQSANRQARDNRRTQDLEVVRSAAEVYRSDCGTYPTSIPWGSSLVGPTTLPCKGNVYMQNVSTDPRSTMYTYKYRWVSSNQYYLCSYYEVLPSIAAQGTIDTNCGGSTACNVGVTPPVGCKYFVTNP